MRDISVQPIENRLAQARRQLMEQQDEKQLKKVSKAIVAPQVVQQSTNAYLKRRVHDAWQQENMLDEVVDDDDMVEIPIDGVLDSNCSLPAEPAG